MGQRLRRGVVVLLLASLSLAGCTVVDDLAFDYTLAREGGVRIILEADVPGGEISSEDLEAARLVIENRLGALDVQQHRVRTQGSDRIEVALPGIADADLIVETVQATGLLEFVDFGYTPLEPGTTIHTDCWLAGGACVSGDAAQDATEYTDGPVYHTVMTGSALSDAYPIPPDAAHGLTKWSVGMAFKPEGRQLFADHTRTHVGQTLGIVLDGEVISSPRIQEAIDNDNSMITGDFTFEEARTLAIQLRYGALFVPLRVVAVEAIEPQSR